MVQPAHAGFSLLSGIRNYAKEDDQPGTHFCRNKSFIIFSPNENS
jgi:hypothetical protein